MFKFQRIFSGGGKWTDNLFLEEEHIGMIGVDDGGIFIKTNKKFTLKELTQLITQITKRNTNLYDKKIEFLPYLGS